MSRLLFVRSVTVLYALVIAVIVFGSSLGFWHPLRAFVNAYSNDKMLHFLLIGTLAMLLNLSMRLRTFGSTSILFQRGTVVMLLIATAEEFSQLLIPARDFEWLDLGSNYLGITILGSAAVLLAFLVRPPNGVVTPLPMFVERAER